MWSLSPQAKAGRSLLFLLQQELYSRNVPNSVGCFEDVFGEAEDPTEIAMTKKGSMFSGVNAVVLVEKAVQWSVAVEYQSSAISDFVQQKHLQVSASCDASAQIFLHSLITHQSLGLGHPEGLRKGEGKIIYCKFRGSQLSLLLEVGGHVKIGGRTYR